MTSKHTPGPWTWGKRRLAESPVGTLYGQSGSVVCDFGDDTEFYPSAGELPSEADARLIAAAPDLLEALWAALGAANGLRLSSADFPRPQIEAAIAKAEGRS